MCPATPPCILNTPALRISKCILFFFAIAFIDANVKVRAAARASRLLFDHVIFDESMSNILDTLLTKRPLSLFLLPVNLPCEERSAAVISEIDILMDLSVFSCTITKGSKPTIRGSTRPKLLYLLINSDKERTSLILSIVPISVSNFCNSLTFMYDLFLSSYSSFESSIYVFVIAYDISLPSCTNSIAERISSIKRSCTFK